jgi:hypothetical protein
LEFLGLHNKPKAEVHPGHKLTGPKEEEEGEEACCVSTCKSLYFELPEDGALMLKHIGILSVMYDSCFTRICSLCNYF